MKEPSELYEISAILINSFGFNTSEQEIPTNYSTSKLSFEKIIGSRPVGFISQL